MIEEHWMNRKEPFGEITPREVRQRLDAGDNLLLLDVREPDEIRIAAVDAAEVQPLSQARSWIDNVPRDREVVVMCHHGGRSAQVAMALAQRGHTNVSNMVGGIDRWSDEVDPTVPKY
jgi:rhodanese-related sulfurtransferase